MLGPALACRGSLLPCCFAAVAALMSRFISSLLASATREAMRARFRPFSKLHFVEADWTCASLDALPIDIDPVSASRVWGPALALADEHNLSVYDAMYLELALRMRLPLATLDRALAAAAQAAGWMRLRRVARRPEGATARPIPTVASGSSDRMWSVERW